MTRVLLAITAVLAAGGSAVAAPAVQVTPNTSRLMPYQVFELTFQHSNDYEDPTWAAAIEVTFTSPSGKAYAVGGFFYGSSEPAEPETREIRQRNGLRRQALVWPLAGGNLWKARYSPGELGRWTYGYTFVAPDGERAAGEGSFDVVKGRAPRKGWIRVHPTNPHRWVLETGGPFFPVGFQHGVGDGNNSGTFLDTWGMEGPFRPDPGGSRPKPPAGAIYQRGPSMGEFNADFKLRRHSQAGFNVFRIAPRNGLPNLFGDPLDPETVNLDKVHWKRAQQIDELMLILRKYGIRVNYGFFGYTAAHNHKAWIKENMDQVKRLIKYSVDRWGAYVDMWEFMNEQDAWPEWYEATVPFLRQTDPYAKPFSTSWNRPELYDMTFYAPHWYSNENELFSAFVTQFEAVARRKFALPILYGEQGNTAADGSAVDGWYERCVPKGIGGVWDIGSARRMRVRLWTAMFHELGFVFWETSYAKDGHRMNQWIGPEERQYVRALQGFAKLLDADVRPVPVRLSGPSAARVQAFGLASDKVSAVYLHQFECAECEAGRTRVCT